MTDATATARAGALDDSLARMPALEVRQRDIRAALATAACGFAVVVAAIGIGIPFAIALVLELAVLAIPVTLLVRRAREGVELTIPVLLVIATAAGGPVGAAGCALTALALRRRRPQPERLREWYEYISGVVERDRTTLIYDEVVSGRVPPDPAASVHRLAPVLSGSSIAEQQRVLGVVGRRYHSELRPVLKLALRHRNGLVRAQAAAIASQLDLDEKTQLWANTPERVRDAIETEAQSSPLSAK